jgi:hypothetical protein
MSAAYTNCGKTTSANREQWAKINTDRKRSPTLRIVSKNHATTAAQVTAEMNIHLEDPVSAKNCPT